MSALMEADKWLPDEPDETVAVASAAQSRQWRVNPAIVVNTANLQAYSDLVHELLAPEAAMGPPLGAVMGLTGRGKTTASRHLAVSTEGVVYVRALSFWTTVDLIREVSFAFTGERPVWRTRALDRIRDACLDRRRLLILDEADCLHMKAHLDPLRGVAEVCNMGIIFVGEEKLTDVLQQERRLWHRIRRVVEFEDLTAGDLAVFWRQAVGYLPPPDVMDALYKRCGGDFRVAVGDAVNLCRLARSLQVNEITTNLLKGLDK